MVGNTTPGGGPLSTGSLASFIASSLPREASPQIQNPYEAIALAIHAGMLSVGFRLVGLGEDHRIEANSDAEQPEPLPREWNESTTYAFRYAHSQSAMEFLIKVNRLASKAVVLGMGIGDDKPTSFDLNVKDYVSESSLPATPLPQHAQPEQSLKPIQDIFISPGRLSDLGSELRVRLIQKLMPSLQKEGYEEERTLESQSSSSRPNRPAPDAGREPVNPEPARPNPFPHDDPLAMPPRRPIPAGDFPPPGFEDEHEILRPPRGEGPLGGGGFGNIGDNDLYPPGLGPRDPIRPSGIGPNPLQPGAGGGGGMHPTFDDPLFAGPGGGREGMGARAPPGARYDPVGPGDAPQDRGRAGRFPGGGFGGAGGAPPNPFSGYGSGDFI